MERVDDFPKLWAKLLADDALEEAGQARIYSPRSAAGDYHFNPVLVVNNEAEGEAHLKQQVEAFLKNLF